jgi:nucleoside phosphorylase
MFFNESKRLAAAHPELRDVLRGLDLKLRGLDKDAVIRANYYAMLLGHNWGRIESTLNLLAEHGVLFATKMMVCEHCDTLNKIDKNRPTDDPRCSLCEKVLGVDSQVECAYRLSSKSAKRVAAAVKRAPIAEGQASLMISNNSPHASQEAPVDFLLITALEQERDILLSKLPGVRKLDRDGTGAHTYYESTVATRRQDGAVYRIIATSLSGMGPIKGAIKAGAIIKRWNPAHVLMVGIAGGIEGEVAPGDVMVASQVPDYTVGKVRDGAPREERWMAYPADANLLDAAVNFPTGWEDLIASVPPEGVASRRHIGVVASGGDVVASKEQIRIYLTDWPKLIGIEMEGGGVAAGLHDDIARPRFLMIRGVSDLANGEDNAEMKKAWREYACHVAAAYAIGLLRDGPVPAARWSANQNSPLSPAPATNSAPGSPATGKAPSGVSVDRLPVTSLQRDVGPTPNAGNSAPENARPLVLWVDDDGPGRFEFEIYCLKREGYRIDFAVDVIQAATLLCYRKYDAVLLDNLIPYRYGSVESIGAWGGYVLYSWLRNSVRSKRAPPTVSLRDLDQLEPNPLNRGVPVLMCTAFHDDEVWSALQSAKLDNEKLLTAAKPINAHTLARWLEMTRAGIQ